MNYPMGFYAALGLVLALSAEAWWRVKRSWAIPALAVYGTIGAWYLGDFLYNGTDDLYSNFGLEWVQRSMWQVALFLFAYRIFVHLLVRNGRDPEENSDVQSRLEPSMLNKFVIMLGVAWACLFAIGLALAEWDLLGVVWPPSRPVKTIMFGHSGMGSGADFLAAAGNYIYILLCASFGVVLVLDRGYARALAMILMAVSWPYFWFDRMRNVMLALLLPAVFCYWFSSAGRWGRKLLISLMLFGFVSLWFQGVMRYREGYESIGVMLEFNSAQEEGSKHLGLDMLTELCWINALMDLGAYEQNFGQRYLAEIAQVVPRTIWPGKPMLGIDYAIARGFGGTGAAEGPDNAAGVVATVATGMIGQGVVNFGPIFGVLSSAFLMALWTKILSRLWLRRFEFLRFLLFAIGCGLIFNMGRDITLLVLWPFVFGYIGVVLIEKTKFGRPAETAPPPESLQT